MTARSKGKSQKQECSAVWLPLNEVLELAKLIYGEKSRKPGCSLGGGGGNSLRRGRRRWLGWRNVLGLDRGSGDTGICGC